MTFIPNKTLPKKMQSTLDSLINHGYIWNYDNAYVKRNEYGNTLNIRGVDVPGKYGRYKIEFSMTRWSAGQAYVLKIYFEELKLFASGKIGNLEDVYKRLVYFAELLNKIRDREIIDVTTFKDGKAHFSIVRCDNDEYIVYSKDIKTQKYEFVDDAKTTDLVTLKNRCKLIVRF